MEHHPPLQRSGASGVGGGFGRVSPEILPKKDGEYDVEGFQSMRWPAASTARGIEWVKASEEISRFGPRAYAAGKVESSHVGKSGAFTSGGGSGLKGFGVPLHEAPPPAVPSRLADRLKEQARKDREQELKLTKARHYDGISRAANYSTTVAGAAAAMHAKAGGPQRSAASHTHKPQEDRKSMVGEFSDFVGVRL